MLDIPVMMTQYSEAFRFRLGTQIAARCDRTRVEPDCEMRLFDSRLDHGYRIGIPACVRDDRQRGPREGAAVKSAGHP
jgi:hypothetical protein